MRYISTLNWKIEEGDYKSEQSDYITRTKRKKLRKRVILTIKVFMFFTVLLYFTFLII